MLKSPEGNTQFDPEDTEVQMAIHNMKLAVDFSLKGNSRALYDRALMQWSEMVTQNGHADGQTHAHAHTHTHTHTHKYTHTYLSLIHI